MLSRPKTRLALMLVALAFVVAAAAWSTVAGPRARGEAFYRGAQPVAARIAGHANDLPADAARCANCHDGPQAIGPNLDGASLAQMQARRGGPPSRYDARALCRLLREGIDPAGVMVPRAMPRYAARDRDCDALWDFLSSR